MKEKEKDLSYLIFHTENGQKVLEDLTRHFAPKFNQVDPVQTHVSVAQSEVVKYIRNNLSMALNSANKINK